MVCEDGDIQVIIDRTSLGLTPLIMDLDATQGYMLVFDGTIEPDFQMRLTYAPDSTWVRGKMLLAAVLDAAFLPVLVEVQGSDSADLEAKRAALEAAVSQFSYEVTLSVSGRDQTWNADPSWPQWGTVRWGDVLSGTSEAAITIPVNPYPLNR